MRADMSKLADMPPISEPEAFGAAIARKMRKKLEELRIGKEGGVKSGVYLWD